MPESRNSDDPLVVLNRTAQSVVEAQRKQHATHVLACQGKLTTRMLNSALLRAREKAGLPQVRVHDLKHTHGRRLRAAGLPPTARSMLALLSEQLRYFSERVGQVERELLRWHRASEPSRRLEAIGGVGPITATAIVASVGDARSFRSARQFAAWLGLVPAQHSSGGKQRLGSISKRGDTYLRTLLIHGARSSLRALQHRPHQQSPWLARLLLRRHPNVVTVAMAHKHARIIWAMLTSGSGFQPELSAQR